MPFSKKTTIAVIGVSENTEKYGNKIFTDLKNSEYLVQGVNPNGGTVAGQQLCTSLSKVLPKPELVITVVPPSITEQVVAECVSLKISAIWMQPGSESEKAIALAQKHNINVVSNACFMVQQGVW